MSHREEILSGATVGVAVVGSALGSLALSLAGPLLGLLIHIWTRYISARDEREKSALVEHLRARNFQLEWEVAKLRGSVPTPPQASP